MYNYTSFDFLTFNHDFYFYLDKLTIVYLSLIILLSTLYVIYITFTPKLSLLTLFLLLTYIYLTTSWYIFTGNVSLMDTSFKLALFIFIFITLAFMILVRYIYFKFELLNDKENSESFNEYLNGIVHVIYSSFFKPGIHPPRDRGGDTNIVYIKHGDKAFLFDKNDTSGKILNILYNNTYKESIIIDKVLYNGIVQPYIPFKFNSKGLHKIVFNAPNPDIFSLKCDSDYLHGGSYDKIMVRANPVLYLFAYARKEIKSNHQIAPVMPTKHGDFKLVISLHSTSAPLPELFL